MATNERGEASILTEDKAVESIVTLIQNKSKEGFLVSIEEIWDRWIDERQGVDTDEARGIELEAILTEELKAHRDLRVIPDQESRPRYYSSRFMSEAYARILIRKEGDPLALIAETIRETSSLCSRPAPMATFSAAPFHLSLTEISACLQQMTQDPRFQDIRQTVTSIGTCFLYSTLFLDPIRASMLSEWLDVGQHQNP